jgi:hypothetical protein
MAEKKTKYPATANKRTPDEVKHHREHVADWIQQGYTYAEIADLIDANFGVRITKEQVRYDVGKIREQWKKATIASYNAYVNEELSWLDSYERQLWRDYRESKKELTQKRIERVMAEMDTALAGGDESGLVVGRIVETMTGSHGDTRFLELIFKARQERRKLLGLYAPHLVGVKIDKTETIHVKGYAEVVSPSHWPDAIEGEVVKSISDNGRNQAN